MSGPPYPHPDPAPGSNAIGSFVIGVSPAGDIPAFDWWLTVINQYANSPALTALLSNFFQYIDQTINLDSFFDLVWNVDTAEGWGLDVWGRIVGVSRTLSVPSDIPYLGFEEQSPTVESFGSGVFYGGQILTTNFSLLDDDFRVLVLAKALANISDGSIPAINQLLLNLFPNRGNAFVADDGNMQMTYTFEFPLSAIEVSIVTQSGVLPKSSGVTVNFVQEF